MEVFGPGETFAFEGSDIRVSHVGSEPALTVHLYSPPLWRMGAYVLEPPACCAAPLMSYVEELRPLKAA